jgi:hypothetical protein
MKYMSMVDMRESLPPSFNAAARVWAHQNDVEAAMIEDSKVYIARIKELELKLMEIGATCNGECGCKGYLQMHFAPVSTGAK